jgi:UDP-N-acetylmuramoyl-L-alanyl-D-glutamate--2,6-diaminopimelate ligase
MKHLIKQFTPKFILSLYHLSLAYLAHWYYGKPSEKLVVVGVTGTNGKSTTVNLIADILEGQGYETMVSSTVNFKIGKSDKLNTLKMTMPGRFYLQRMLAEAVKKGCTHAVIESSSEGVVQHRHIGIHYDAMVFTNLTPEHLESHGGFENYKQAKLTYFKNLAKLPSKWISGKQIPKIIAYNSDDKYAAEFADFNVDKKISYGTSSAEVRGTDLKVSPEGISFMANNLPCHLQLKGRFDFYNALAALAMTNALGVKLEQGIAALEKVELIPGRMEVLQRQPFTVIVDYAPEPESLKQLYGTIETWPKNRIIHLLGSTGGGRDKARRKILGNMAGRKADIVIVTNEDPYDDDPTQIIHDVADGAVEVGKVIKETLFREPDRRKAIAKAFSLAQPGDLVLLTGKGSEQKMAVKGGYIPWDDRQVAREELKKMQ